MGVMKDLIRYVHDSAASGNFRSYIVHISIEAMWNIIEVVGESALDLVAGE